jgi:hypothetical protein
MKIMMRILACFTVRIKIFYLLGRFHLRSDFSQQRIEFGSERIPRGLLRGKRANAELLFLKNRRFSAASCGELQICGAGGLGQVNWNGRKTVTLFML